MRRQLGDRQQSHGWSDPAGWDLVGSRPIFTSADVSCSRISHISYLVPLGDEFSGFIAFMKLIRDFIRLTSGT